MLLFGELLLRNYESHVNSRISNYSFKTCSYHLLRYFYRQPSHCAENGVGTLCFVLSIYYTPQKGKQKEIIVHVPIIFKGTFRGFIIKRL
jgi:hypothetical protein